MTIQPNDPAMPSPKSTERHTMVNGEPVIKFDKHNQGMSIRTELAARAMQGIIASGVDHETKEDVARVAVSMADALISELNKDQ